MKSDIQDALTGLAAGETTSHQLAGLVRQAIDGGGIYQLLNELGVPVEKSAEALGTESAAEGAFTLFNDLGIVQVAHLPAGGCGCVLGTNHMNMVEFCSGQEFFTSESGATVCSTCEVPRRANRLRFSDVGFEIEDDAAAVPHISIRSSTTRRGRESNQGSWVQ